MSNYDYDVVVLGSGPGGYVAAIRASQLGLKTAIVERENLGGVCLNWGCIPTKALIHNTEVLETLHDAESLGFTFENLKVDYAAAVKRSRDISGRQAKGVGFLMRKNKIEVIEGHGVFTDPHTLQVSPTEYFPESKERTVTAANVIIAVGARARGLPGVEIDGDRIIQYRDAIVMDKLPKKLIVVGSGAIGMEFSYIYNAYGVEVTVVEMLDQLLPGEDKRTARTLQQAFKKAGVDVVVKNATEGAEKTKKGVKVTVKNLKDDSTETLEADKVLMAAGSSPIRTRPAWMRRASSSASAALSRSTSGCAPTCRTSTPSATARASWRWRMWRAPRLSSPPRRSRAWRPSPARRSATSSCRAALSAARRWPAWA